MKKEPPLCPRCKKYMKRKAVWNARSRVDSRTLICSRCGSDEAMFNYTTPGVPLPPLDQTVFGSDSKNPRSPA